LADALAEAKTITEQAQQDLKASENQVQALVAAKRVAEAETTTTQAQLETVQARLDGKDAESAALHKTLMDTVTELKAECKKLMDERKNEAADLREQLMTASRQAASEQGRADALSRQVESLQAETKEVRAQLAQKSKVGRPPKIKTVEKAKAEPSFFHGN